MLSDYKPVTLLNNSTHEQRLGQLTIIFERNIHQLIFAFRDEQTKQGPEIKDQCRHTLNLEQHSSLYENEEALVALREDIE